MKHYTNLYPQKKNVILSKKYADYTFEFLFLSEIHEGVKPSNYYHFHSLYEIHVCAKGMMTIFLEDNSIILHEGDVCVIPPNIVHDTRPDQGSFCVGFRFRYYPTSKKYIDFSSIPERAFTPLKNAILIKTSDIYDSYLSLVVKNLKSFKNDNVIAELLVLSLYELGHVILGETDDDSQDDNQYTKTTMAENIEDFINANYTQNFVLADLSSFLNLSTRQTQRLIAELFNMTFSELLNKKRLSASKPLLKNTKKSIEEIAYLCGFSDKTYFHRKFSELYNTTPAKYRKS